MRLAALLPLALLLSGCAECGMTPEEVRWTNPDFAYHMMDDPPSGWDVQVEPPRPGLPVEEPRLASWNATVTSMSHRFFGPNATATLKLTPGTLHLSTDGGRPPRLREDLTAALLVVTDGNLSERHAWADALLDPPSQRSSTELPPDRVSIEGLVADHLPERPQHRFRAGSWEGFLSFPTVRATSDGMVFAANPVGENWFRDPAWSAGDKTEDEVLERFRTVYAGLGYGEQRGGWVTGSVC